MGKVDVVYMKVEDLIPYENNPRMNEHAVEKVANSIKEFGFKQPIVVDKNMVIIAGHTRLKASIELGLKEVPVLVAEDLTPEQVRAYRLADNKTAELADWNYEELQKELDDLEFDFDLDMSDFGFLHNDFDIDDFFDAPSTQSEEAEEHESEAKIITCPHCDTEFEYEL